MKRVLAGLLLWAVIVLPASASCFAAPFGSGSFPVSGQTAEGRWWYWWCPGPFGHTFRVMAAKHGYVPKIPDMTGLSVGEAMQALWDANVEYSCEPDSPIRGLCVEAAKHAVANQPAAPYYVVAANRGFPDRPLYEFNGEELGRLIPDSRAPVGKACDCKQSGFMRGNVAYCMLAGYAKDAVAVCSQVTQ